MTDEDRFLPVDLEVELDRRSEAGKVAIAHFEVEEAADSKPRQFLAEYESRPRKR